MPVVSRFKLGNLEIMKVISPGARCDSLLPIAAKLSVDHSFDHVVVNVGANYIRQQISPVVVAAEISDFLGALTDLFGCKMSGSCVLPQRNVASIEDINFINNRVNDFCASRGVGLFQYPQFKRVRGKLDTSLFAIDGIHPSRYGVKALFDSFVEHIKLENKWGDLDR